jgi:hypothetical protein
VKPHLFAALVLRPHLPGCSRCLDGIPVGFKPDVRDYITFGTLFVLVVAFLSFVVFLGLPGRIAIARKHPEAEAVNLMGRAGFMAIIPWIKALIWALKPTNAVDIR